MSKPRRVGLLFVHGIGEQEPWEHLHSAASRLAELLRNHPHPGASVSVVDRTANWDEPLDPPRVSNPENPDKSAPLAPLTIQYRVPSTAQTQGFAVDFECHEVWWADPGKRRGLGEGIKFWLWGLGQWNAPIYANRDATKLSHSPEADDRPSVHIPRSTSLSPLVQIFSRLSLAWACIIASLIVLSTWGIFRILSFITGKKVSLDLIVDYVGDVEIYQKRGTPDGGQTSDPGHPTRVAIRRRMVRQMVAMGARDYDNWSILAHSLGSVLAFNGIGEIAHTLPNYCEEELWNSLPDDLKRDPDCLLRDDTQDMIPARPAWLNQKDCINKTKLFGNLTNFITYGSPLGTFAAIWPRIVAFEKGVGEFENKRRTKGVFDNARWINIVSGGDPVSGLAERYGEYLPDAQKSDLPEEANLVRPSSTWYGASHTAYFKPEWPSARGKGSAPSRYASFHDEVIGQILREPAPPPPLSSKRASVASHDRQRMVNSFLATLVVFLVCFSGLGMLISLLGGTLPEGFEVYAGAVPYPEGEDFDWHAAAQTIPGWGLFWLSLVMGAVYTAGIIRYSLEVYRDFAENKYELNANPKPTPERAKDLKIGTRIDRVSLWANVLFGIPTTIAWMLIFASMVGSWGECWPWLGDLTCALERQFAWIQAFVPAGALLLLLLMNSMLQAGLSLWAVWLRKRSE